MSDRRPKAHALKTEPQYFQATLDGVKTFEIRRNDRGFQVGDILLLLEYDRATRQYTGRAIERAITYILDQAPYTPPGYVALGLRGVVPEGQIRPELARFAADMEAKLAANDHKPHWQTMDLSRLMYLLQVEMGELVEAALSGEDSDAADEAVDVANLAMMVADVATQRDRERAGASEDRAS